MPSLGNLFTAIGRMLPGFYEGERLAIQDNWQDLKNYNDVQRGQMDNAWTAATWQHRLDNVANNALNNAYAVEQSQMNNALMWERFPGEMDAAATMSANGGRLAAARLASLYRQLAQAGIDIGSIPTGTAPAGSAAPPSGLDANGNGTILPMRW